MFSGIVEETGIINAIERKKNLATIKVSAKRIVRGLKKGDSVAVDGVCLTVTQIRNTILSFDLMKETLDQTTLGVTKRKNVVNLERALKVGDRISGHFVTGHIDTFVPIVDIIKRDNYTEIFFKVNKGISPYIVPKGSVCIDGISLTVGKVGKGSFSVYLIPYTLQETTL